MGLVFLLPLLLLLSLLALQSIAILDLTCKYVVKMACKKQEAMELHGRSWIYVYYFLCTFSSSSDKQRISWFFILFKDVIISQACFIKLYGHLAFVEK